jgi:hypothetical protein
MHAIKLFVVVMLCMQNSVYSLLRRYSQVCPCLKPCPFWRWQYCSIAAMSFASAPRSRPSVFLAITLPQYTPVVG